MVVLTNALERILKGMQKYDAPIASLLQPGLSFWEIEEKVRVLPFRLPQEVYELYQWRNGLIQGARGWSQGWGGHDFYNLDFLIKNYFDSITYSEKCPALDNDS
ncbi:hypothetical protein QT970_10715 [Microcoleus sp. herbarium8]|uniref:hypothetical protein n=1 Tax=Microcoleus sp. herbarium8 TaxID=3055436 RepID=UPI002FD0B2CD